MCTVTWSFRAKGELRLCFNRDERHERATSLPPLRWDGDSIAPVDATAGGTWLAVRRDGVVLALLNHYPKSRISGSQAASASRGSIIPQLASQSVTPCVTALRRLTPHTMLPYRLLVLTPAAQASLFTWNGGKLSVRDLPNGVTGMLTSSSWQSASVYAARRGFFRAWSKAHTRPSLNNLREFHSITMHPRGPAWAICMTRDDAQTVSLNTLSIGNQQARMTHQQRPRDASSFDAHITSADMPTASTP